MNRKTVALDINGRPVFIAPTALHTQWLIATTDGSGDLCIAHKIDLPLDDGRDDTERIDEKGGRQ